MQRGLSHFLRGQVPEGQPSFPKCCVGHVLAVRLLQMQTTCNILGANCSLIQCFLPTDKVLHFILEKKLWAVWLHPQAQFTALEPTGGACMSPATRAAANRHKKPEVMGMLWQSCVTSACHSLLCLWIADSIRNKQQQNLKLSYKTSYNWRS